MTGNHSATVELDDLPVAFFYVRAKAPGTLICSYANHACQALLRLNPGPSQQFDGGWLQESFGARDWSSFQASLAMAEPDGATILWEGVMKLGGGALPVEVRLQSIERNCWRAALLPLSKSEDRSTRLVSVVPGLLYEYVLFADGTSRYLYAGPGCRELLEVEPAQLLADSGHFWNLVHPDDLLELQKEDRKANREGDFFLAECRIITPSGRLKWVHLRSRPLPVVADQPAIWCGVMLDITQRRQAEIDLQTSLEQKLRTSLTASAIGHEIGQPLGLMLLQTHVAMRLLEAPDPSLNLLRTTLGAVLKEGQRVQEISESMRCLLRNMHTLRGRVDLAAVIISAIRYYRDRFDRQSRVVGLITSGLDREIWLEGDEVQLHLALINLLRNAHEAIADGSATAPGMISLSLSASDDAVTVAVADSGPGFSEEALAALPLMSTKPRGTGLGLYVVQTTMENHGGRLSIGRSQQWGGADVRLVLPCRLGLRISPGLQK